jgi:hypothetical protein
MATVWDFVSEFDAPIINTQRTTVRAKTKRASFTIIAVAAGALFCANDTALAWVEEGVASVPVIGVQRVLRTELPPKKPVRAARAQYAPDARDGLSTHRLAQTFGAIFTPVEEESPSVDYSFG